jgi:hypothetical protein
MPGLWHRYVRGFATAMTLFILVIGIAMPLDGLDWGLTALACPGREYLFWGALATFGPFLAYSIGSGFCSSFQTWFQGEKSFSLSRLAKLPPFSWSWKRAYLVGWLHLIALPLILVGLVVLIQGASYLLPDPHGWRSLVIPCGALVVIPFLTDAIFSRYVALCSAWEKRLASRTAQDVSSEPAP